MREVEFQSGLYKRCRFQRISFSELTRSVFGVILSILLTTVFSSLVVLVLFVVGLPILYGRLSPEVERPNAAAVRPRRRVPASAL